MRAERIEDAARALLAVVDGREKGLRGYYIDAKRFDALRAALELPADAAGSAEAVRAACAAVPALEEARRRRLRWADEAHAQILAVPAPAQPAPEGAGEAVALPMRGDVGKPEATRDPIFLLRWRPRNRPIRGDRWTVEGVWFTREEAEEFARGHAYRWGSDKHGPCWQVYCVPADGTLAALLRARTAYNVAKVPPLYAHPTPRAEAASAEAVREACADRVRDEAGAWRSQVQRRLESDKATWADVVQARHYAEACERVESALRSLPLPAAPASAEATVWANLLEALVGLRAKDDAEAVAREAAREAVRLADSDRGDGATSMSEEAIINRAVAHALRAGKE